MKEAGNFANSGFWVNWSRKLRASRLQINGLAEITLSKWPLSKIYVCHSLGSSLILAIYVFFYNMHGLIKTINFDQMTDKTDKFIKLHIYVKYSVCACTVT